MAQNYYDVLGVDKNASEDEIKTAYRKLAKKYQAGYVPDMQCAITPKGRPDLWSDKNHPNAAGNRIVADTILPELQRILSAIVSGK